MNTKETIKLVDKARNILDLIECIDHYIIKLKKSCDGLVYRFPSIVEKYRFEIEWKKQVKKRLENYLVNTLNKIEKK